MSEAVQIEENSIHWDSSDPLELLQGQLQDLLLIHLRGTLLDYHRASPSIYLHACQYVCGENSAARSFMRFDIKTSPSKEEADHPGAVTLTLELSVKQKGIKCSDHLFRQAPRSQADY